MTILVTGGAGFIGANFVLDWLEAESEPVINLDKLTYAGNLGNLESVHDNDQHVFVRGDICDSNLVHSLLQKHRPRAVVHFAAESHVDRSIHGPAEFVSTNIVGTFTLLEQCRDYWDGLDSIEKKDFRFVHVSTDEVYGSLEMSEPAFLESTAYAPNSPYAASKASSDHLVRAYHHTYGLPVLTSNCSNNYGRFQFPEKLIPLMILKCLDGEPLPIYGDGLNVRDWLYVGDHCSAIRLILRAGKPGQTYNVGGCNELTNIDLVTQLCEVIDELRPDAANVPHSSLISYVKDRPGHDRRYAVDAGKIQAELGWSPSQTFQTGIRKTVEWYLENQAWTESVTSGSYMDWIDTNYAQRSSN